MMKDFLYDLFNVTKYFLYGLAVLGAITFALLKVLPDSVLNRTLTIRITPLRVVFVLVLIALTIITVL